MNDFDHVRKRLIQTHERDRVLSVELSGYLAESLAAFFQRNFWTNGKERFSAEKEIDSQ